MRTFIIIVVSMLVPFGLWTAGCRQDRQAAFPNTPEMQALAKAPEQQSPTRPPVIPQAPVDRDILNLPEHTVMARVNAVKDRSDMLAGSRVNPGLFVLPGEQEDLASTTEKTLPYEPYESNEWRQPVAVAAVPRPSAREFWSKPAAPLKTQPAEIPHDVSAMMPSAPARSYVLPPAPVMAPVMPVNDDMLLLPEDVPGIFMETDAMPLSQGGFFPPFQPWAEFAGRQGAALGAPPLLSCESFESVPAQDLGSIMRSEEEPRKKSPLKLDLLSFLGSMRGIADAVLPPSESFPELSPVEMLAPFESRAATTSLADVSRSVGQTNPDELVRALAPLPDLTGSGAKPAPVMMPLPMPEPLPPPEVLAAKAELAAATREIRDETSKMPIPNSREFFLADFREQKAPVFSEAAGTPAITAPLASDLGKQKKVNAPLPVIQKKDAEQFFLPGRPEPHEVKRKNASKMTDVGIMPDEPKKVKLEPIQPNRIRELGPIDAAAAVPPLRF